MIQQSREQDAVSPVVGVILMVALTVILAAVLSQFAFRLTSLLQSPIQAGVTFQETPTETIGDNEYNVTVLLSDSGNADKLTVNCPTGLKQNISEVGNSAKCNNAPAGSQITVIGEKSGQKTVIQTYTIGPTN
jgi:flagellin-like protein